MGETPGDSPSGKIAAMKLIKVVLTVIAGTLFCDHRTQLDASPLQATFINTARIKIPPVGCARPYPSTISVSNLSGVISEVSVTLSNLSHSYPDDLDVSLLTPAGQRIVLMSDAGGCFKATDAVLTFRSSAANSLPDLGRIVSGTFLPTDYDDGWEDFVGRGSTGGHSSTLAGLNGSNPNGDWSLYVTDDLKRDRGTIACGWQLGLTLDSPPAIVAAVEIPISERGAVWKYSDTGANQGTAWQSNFFNDAGWLSGAAQLGFGDFDEATIINGGPFTNRYITTHFRRALTVSDPSLYTNLALRLLRDDGAVVYLNGAEIFRSNMPTGQIGFATFASTAVEGAAESGFATKTVFPGLLRAGLNVLAVEVHQVDRTSPDLSFDLELLASGPLLPGVTTAPTFVSVPAGSTLTLRAEPQGGPFSYRWLLNETPLPGATNATLQISGVHLGNAGAYTVLVSDVSGRTSVLGPMDLILSAPSVPDVADSFSQNMTLFGIAGSVQGSSTLASRENLEPFHAGHAGTRSVWFSWSPPVSGIATLSTRGSSFDTLLAIYQGNSFTNLSPLASDDDGGGLFTSLVQFNVSTGATYRIALDGLNEAGGAFALNWSVEPTTNKVPVVQVPPVSQSVPLGSIARFFVGVEDTTSTYQWYRDGLPIVGAVNDTLIISDVQSSDLGRYFARVIDPSGRFIDTTPGDLQIGDCALVSVKYFSNLIPCPDIHMRPSAQVTSPFATANVNIVNTNPTSGGTPGSLGVGGWQYGEVQWGSENGGMASYDGTTLIAPRQFIIEAKDDGFLELDTCGTEFPVLLALYTNVAISRLDTPLNRIASDLDSALLEKPASITVQVKRGFYRLAAAPLPSSGAQLTDSNFRWSMRLGPSCYIVTPPAVQTLTVNTSAPSATAFQWYRNGNPLLHSTQQRLVLNITDTNQVGSYTLVMSNALGGKQTNLVADIIIPDEYYFRRGFQLVREGDVLKFHIESRAGSPLVLETATEVDPQLPMEWSPIVTNRCIGYTDCNFAGTSRRFFRLRPEVP